MGTSLRARLSVVVALPALGEHPIRKLVNVTHAGDSAHDSVNPGQTPARFVLAAFEPGVGPSRRSEGTGV
jgi:hypothetical protein